jgi:hypothetical protein
LKWKCQNSEVFRFLKFQPSPMELQTHNHNVYCIINCTHCNKYKELFLFACAYYTVYRV